MEVVTASLLTAAAPAATAASAVTGGLSLLSAVQSGYAQEAAMKMQAEGVKEQAHMEKLKAQEDSNLRRERLLNALAAQNAKAGAGGVKGGTTEQLKLQSISDYEKEQEGADLMASQQSSYRSRQASGLRAQGGQLSRGSLLRAATALTEIG